MIVHSESRFIVVLLNSLLISGYSAAELTALEDESLSGVSAQAGLTLEVENEAILSPVTGTQNQYLQAESLTWSSDDQDNGSTLTIENVGFGQAEGGAAAPKTIYTVDVDDSTGVNVGIAADARRVTVNDIRLASNYIETSSPDTDYQKGFGAFILDYRIGGIGYVISSSAYDFSGDAKIQITPVPDVGGIRLKGGVAVHNANLIYQDKLNSGSHDFLVSNLNAGLLLDQPGSSLDFNIVEGAAGDYIQLGFSNVYGALSIAGLHHETYDASTGTSLGWGESLGSLEMGIVFDGTLNVSPASSGLGIVLKSDLSSNCNTSDCLSAKDTTSGRNFIAYKDDGVRLGLANYFGQLSSDSGLSIELIKGTGGDGDYILVGFGDLVTRFGVEDIYIGNANTSLGEVFGELRFGSTPTFKGQKIASNRLKVFPGGGRGRTGLTVDLSLNLEDGSIRYADDIDNGGGYVWFTGLAAHIEQGTVTADVVKQQTFNTGNLSDGLRLGFNDLKGAWRVRGLYVTDSATDLPTNPDGSYKPLQGGAEVLYLLRLYQAFDFEDWDANVYISGGGGTGRGQGLTMNIDSVISDATGGLLIDYSDTCPNGCGIWSEGLNLQSNIRNLTFNVEQGVTDFTFMNSSGLITNPSREAIYIRSTLFGYKDVNRIHFGNYDALTQQTSIGSLSINEYQNMDIAISTGGDTSRGSQGLTIYLKNEFLEKDSAAYQDYAGTLNDGSDDFTRDKVNSLRWTPDRDANADAYLEVSGITTDAGGVRNTLNIDVSPTQANQQGFAVNILTEANQIRVDDVNIGGATIINEAALYNLRMQSNVIATPIN